MAEQWYYCGTEGFNFPASEMSSHRGHKTWEVKDVQTEEDDSWEDDYEDDGK